MSSNPVLKATATAQSDRAREEKPRRLLLQRSKGERGAGGEGSEVTANQWEQKNGDFVGTKQPDTKAGVCVLRMLPLFVSLKVLKSLLVSSL
ncbi:hypothetical protein VZT92_024174 [Zoarces viviparus]|uniref:Uncharacterized protein n=1 Tax=Zoarces viviparus TaxID=48416 RepID=A0AAW1E0T7_ZOAVI